MALSSRRLNRATLDRQLLLRRERSTVVDAVRRVVALQAQEAASPYLALWNRLVDFDPAQLDAAFAEHAVAKATLMRITLHAVTADDYPTFRRAMEPSLRASRLNDRRFAAMGLSAADADGIVGELVEFGDEAHTNAEFEAVAIARLGALPPPGVWWAIRTYGPFVHAPNAGPWSFGPRPAYLAAPHGRFDGDHAAAVRTLVRRYLEGFGPASVADVAQFTLLSRAVAGEALQAQLDTLLRLDGPDGVELFDVPDAPLPPEDTAAPPRLMAMWDSVLLAYADRGRTIPPEYRALVIRRNGDVLPTLLVDGLVAGVWRAVDGGIEVAAFHRLSSDAWHGIAEEAAGLVALLSDREPRVYRRYARWWSALPAADIQVIPG